MDTTLPDAWRGVAGAPSLTWVGISPPMQQGSRMVTRGLPLYRGVMTSADRTSRRVGAAVSALWSAPAWRATGSALAAFLVGLVGGLLLGGLAIIWGAAIASLASWPVGGWAHAVLYIAVVIAVPVLALWAVQGLTALQRSRLRATLGVDIPAGPLAAGRKPWPIGPGLAAAAAIGYLAAAPPPAAAGAAACAAAVALLLAAPWAARLVTRADEASARALLGPSRSEELALRVESLARSRADVVAATDAERRRIERDLHDGAQQRLVSLAMNLGMARERFAGDPQAARTLLDEAHDEAKRALAELRDLARGIHPAVLADRGLDAAISALAARSPVPVEVGVDLRDRPPGAIESTAYFVVAEALANVAKHAAATHAQVRITKQGGRLVVEVRDDGVGGADPAGGSGLAGLADRVASIDGRLTVASPQGGPTVVRAELPCGS